MKIAMDIVGIHKIINNPIESAYNMMFTSTATVEFSNCDLVSDGKQF